MCLLIAVNDSEDDGSQGVDCMASGGAYPRIVVVHVKNPVSNLSMKESLERCQHGTGILLTVLTLALTPACEGHLRTHWNHQ